MGKIIEFDPSLRGKTNKQPDKNKVIKLSKYRRFRQRPLSRFIPEMEGNIVDSGMPEWFRRRQGAIAETLETLKLQEQQKWRKKL